jgi:hypothetical protein
MDPQPQRALFLRGCARVAIAALLVLACLLVIAIALAFVLSFPASP